MIPMKRPHVARHELHEQSSWQDSRHEAQDMHDERIGPCPSWICVFTEVFIHDQGRNRPNWYQCSPRYRKRACQREFEVFRFFLSCEESI